MKFMAVNLSSICALIVTTATFGQEVSPEDKAELERRISIWEQRAPLCTRTGSKGWKPFLSKELLDEALAREVDKSRYKDGKIVPATKPDPKVTRCDDEDSVFFGGILCLASDERGCQLVRQAQDRNGMWWRSPRQKAVMPKDAGNLPTTGWGWLVHDDEGHTNFSTDAALGLMAYLLKKRHDPQVKQAFQDWIDWIDENPRCTTFCGPNGRGSPRFCESDECYFQVTDCPQLQITGKALGVKVPFCSVGKPFLFTPDELTEQLIGRLSDKKARIFNRALIIGKPREKLDKQFNDIANDLRDQSRVANRLVNELPDNPRLEAIGIYDHLLSIGAYLNRDRKLHPELEIEEAIHTTHNAALSILLLEMLDISTTTMHSLAQDLAEREPLNPFFHYVAHRNSPQLPKLIFDACPEELGQGKTQWQWERFARDWEHPAVKDNKQHGSIGWDCIAMAKLALNPIPPTYGTDDSTLQEVAKAVNTARELTRVLVTLIDTIDRYTKFDSMDSLSEPAEKLAKKIEDEVKQRDATAKALITAQMAERNKHVRKIAELAKKNLPKPPEPKDVLDKAKKAKDEAEEEAKKLIGR